MRCSLIFIAILCVLPYRATGAPEQVYMQPAVEILMPLQEIEEPAPEDVPDVWESIYILAGTAVIILTSIGFIIYLSAKIRASL